MARRASRRLYSPVAPSSAVSRTQYRFPASGLRSIRHAPPAVRAPSASRRPSPSNSSAPSRMPASAGTATSAMGRSESASTAYQWASPSRAKALE